MKEKEVGIMVKEKKEGGIGTAFVSEQGGNGKVARGGQRA